MDFTTEQIVGIINQLQQKLLDHPGMSIKDNLFAANIAVSKIEQGVARKDTASYPIIAELLCLAYADKALVALSACTDNPKQNRLRKAYRDMLTSKSLRPVIEFGDELLSRAQKNQGDPFVIQCNLAEVKAAYALCETLRKEKGYNDDYVTEVLLETSSLISPTNAETSPGGAVDTVLKGLFAGVGHILGSMASARTNYCVSSLVAMMESRSDEEREFIGKMVSPEVVAVFEEGEESEAGIEPVVEHIKAEFHQLRQAVLASLDHMVGEKHCRAEDITLGDVRLERDEDGHVTSQLPVQIGEKRYDLLMSMLLGDWKVGESMMFIPFQLQLMPEEV